MKTTDQLQIRKLNIDEARKIYLHHLQRDFPRNEVKPFSIIRKRMLIDRYQAFGAFAGDHLAGYAFFFEPGKDSAGQNDHNNHNHHAVLLDYFAVVNSLRGCGYGSAILKQLCAPEMEFPTILIESERVTDDLSEEVIRIRERRIRFYENAGAFRTGIRTHVNGADYEILILSSRDKTVSKEDAYALTTRIYTEMYPAAWFPELAWICPP